MRIGIYPADSGGCGHYRLIWPGEAAARGGADVTIIDSHSDDAVVATLQQDTLLGYDKSGAPLYVPHVVGLGDRPPFDVIVLQRPLHRLLVESIPFLQRSGVAVVVEVDDDFVRMDPRNVAWPPVQPRLSPDRNYEWLQLAVEMADLVTVSTPALADVYRPKVKRSGRAPVVLPNYLPAHAYAERVIVNPPPLTVGWSGSIKTHPVDLLELGGAIRDLARHPDFARFHVIGSGERVREQLGLPEFVSMTTTDGWLPLDGYHAALDSLDVGLVPLKASRFNEGKSWLKGMEYAARGIPCVASPTGPYRALALRTFGGCVIAERPKDWYRILRRWFDDPHAHVAAADAAHEAALRLCIDLHAERWVDAWTLAYTYRRAAA